MIPELRRVSGAIRRRNIVSFESLWCKWRPSLVHCRVLIPIPRVEIDQRLRSPPRSSSSSSRALSCHSFTIFTPYKSLSCLARNSEQGRRPPCMIIQADLWRLVNKTVLQSKEAALNRNDRRHLCGVKGTIRYTMRHVHGMPRDACFRRRFVTFDHNRTFGAVLQLTGVSLQSVILVKGQHERKSA